MHERSHSARRKRGLDPAFPRLLGGQLCLDFANSVEDPAGSDPHDFLRDYGELVRWGRHAALLSEAQAEALLAEADRRPEAAADSFDRALVLRGAVDCLFHAVARGERPSPDDLKTMQDAYIAALRHAELESDESGFAWVWPSDGEPQLDAILWVVARSAVDLLLTGDPKRIKECAPDIGGCTWLFYDASKNASRRWCSMEGCGSHVKMRRYLARKRETRA
jgi:predicted RNA-binding Zn ribbon-like protein